MVIIVFFSILKVSSLIFSSKERSLSLYSQADFTSVSPKEVQQCSLYQQVSPDHNVPSLAVCPSLNYKWKWPQKGVVKHLMYSYFLCLMQNHFLKSVNFYIWFESQ